MLGQDLRAMDISIESWRIKVEAYSYTEQTETFQEGSGGQHLELGNMTELGSEIDTWILRHLDNRVVHSRKLHFWRTLLCSSIYTL